ncbi:hypothetical protein A2767_07485 [Candidatus Roizmanbacteria bacterium RIFCSPHIGHO2_01_FULL_35_10]|uniref:Uncharacterized protein n=1 Tax=Candidatus Roizmanbacteria bacterium RIFCSPLOWO2_01_FULL_35_13 TaxID=1802055 RepID=A0A1F7IB38_9BACT|nr:MAG: hypothetical protein A2767_07485 [Candidatus Roizmanbacteria bacterium RIFCSPHIGHO2_01_FULL_35_10]OGK40560.1 MAG: hypothetical protein A3A74_00330 [Candidatus Roizmanbacteria bacterium RIFCSPLOWO2_01_FULL_35_13]
MVQRSPEEPTPEAGRNPEQVLLTCPIPECGQIILNTTLSRLRELKKNGNLTHDLALPYIRHMTKTKHVGLNSNHEKVIIDDFSKAVIPGRIGIRVLD